MPETYLPGTAYRIDPQTDPRVQSQPWRVQRGATTEDAGPTFAVPKGLDDLERLGPIVERLDVLRTGSRAQLIRITAWADREAVGCRVTAAYWVLRNLAEVPEGTTGITLQACGEFCL